ncbi:hypothetical protein BDY17DRAFT_328293 [Neohortaea acidophila]|uniref:WW domain-containing protein n=1 Tax=Neohortaea acidophila TaxID=245834 RepID=A0A6A6PHN0_9PEZI|nr:uncharacterized protein BDY17DRAFT_328293 [Neohortaea acidophila]KAF2478777.1 hypothetical protein BDY17DRAFT_328293 [Neohortaea acidophila]
MDQENQSARTPSGQEEEVVGTAASAPAQQDMLPPGWQELVDNEGRTYYANHATRTTTFERPETLPDASTFDLPPGWEVRRNPEGVAYYVDHSTRTTTFERPETRSEAASGDLPAGWELLRTPDGVAYFADHNTRTTTFEDPRRA